MSNQVAEFISTQPGDATEFLWKARALAIGVARDYVPARLYVIRIDNWFGPRWMHFTGKALGLVGVHQSSPLHIPPFVPHRVIKQRAFIGPAYEETVETPPLHIECPSSRALQRRITDVDRDAAFVWISGQSEAQRRGSVLVYLTPSDATAHRPDALRHSAAFYVGFAQGDISWNPTMLRGISLGEMAHLEQTGRASIDISSIAVGL